MAGHSKWANIKRRKGAQDAKRGKLFTKLIKEITVAARMGGGDIDANPRLRLAVDKARSNSMPKDNIKRAIAKGAGDVDTDLYQELTYEGYAPGGVAVMVEALTDNVNRTVSEVRHAFNKGNGNMGNAGCVGYMFKQQGIITGDAEGVDEDALMEVALEAGADDVDLEDGSWEVIAEVPSFPGVRDALEAAGYTPASAELSYIPDNRVEISGAAVDHFMRLIDLLEELDDVQEVHHNAEISDADLERF
jgi:YebC/PmpR family DNA-binding regulatory protein